MRVLRALFFPFMICALQTNAQTELDGKGILSGNDAALRTMEFYNRLMMDSAKYVIDAMKANLLPTPMESSELSYLNTYKDKAMHDIGLAGQHAPMGVKSFNLWSGGHLSINGTTNRMLGLMVFQTGSLSLHHCMAEAVNSSAIPVVLLRDHQVSQNYLKQAPLIRIPY